MFTTRLTTRTHPWKNARPYDDFDKLSVDSDQPFLLHVGGNQWYKNRLGVLCIFSILRKLTRDQTLTLVMVGKPWTAEMRQFVVENGMSDVTLELTGGC